MDLFDTKKVKVGFNYVPALREIGSALNLVLYPNNENVQQLLKNVATSFDIRFHEDARYVKQTTANVNAVNGLEDTASPIIMTSIPIIVQNLKTMSNEIDSFLKSRTNNFALKMAALAKEKAEFDRAMKDQIEEAIEDHKNAVEKLMVVFPPKTDSPTLERKENNSKGVAPTKGGENPNEDDDGIELSPSFEFEKEKPSNVPLASVVYSSLSLADFSTGLTNPDIGSSSLPPPATESSSSSPSSSSSTSSSSSETSSSASSSNPSSNSSSTSSASESSPDSSASSTEGQN